MKRPKFTIVTATAGVEKAQECLASWNLGTSDFGAVVVHQTERDDPLGLSRKGPFVLADVPDYLGPVPAFRLGVDLALQITDPRGVIACLHDDLLIEEPNWDAKVMSFFNQHPECGLLGFGGGTGLGAEDIYRTPYDPMQLARQGFVSNMRDAEAHGRRSTDAVRVACLDGFSQIGRVAYWQGQEVLQGLALPRTPPLQKLDDAGVVHHAYDAYLGGIANSRGWQVWMLPIRCHHYGGQTAVGDPGYQEWARAQFPAGNGDAHFWEQAHRTVYDLLRGVLPLRIR